MAHSKISTITPKALITFVPQPNTIQLRRTPKKVWFFRLNVAIDPLGYGFTLESAAPNAIND